MGTEFCGHVSRAAAKYFLERTYCTTWGLRILDDFSGHFAQILGIFKKWPQLHGMLRQDFAPPEGGAKAYSSTLRFGRLSHSQVR